jgi:hypothetical protein
LISWSQAMVVGRKRTEVALEDKGWMTKTKIRSTIRLIPRCSCRIRI